MTHKNYVQNMCICTYKCVVLSYFKMQSYHIHTHYEN